MFFFCHVRLMSVSRTFPLLWPKTMCLHNFWHTRQRFWKNSLSWPTCLHASSSTKWGGDQSEHSILSRDLSPASLKTSSHSAFAESKTMETFHPRMSKVAHGRVHVSQNGAESYRGQSSWSGVLRGWCLYSMMVMHIYLLRHMAGKDRVQCLDKCTGVGWVEHV